MMELDANQIVQEVYLDIYVLVALQCLHQFVLKNVGILSLHQTKTVKMETLSTLMDAPRDVFEKQDGHVHGWPQDQSACQYAETDFEFLQRFAMTEEFCLTTEDAKIIAKE